MAQKTIEQLYRSEKYNIMGNVVQDLLKQGLNNEELHTKIEMLIIKHTLITAETMKAEGDYVSEISDTQSLSFYEEG